MSPPRYNVLGPPAMSPPARRRGIPDVQRFPSPARRSVVRNVPCSGPRPTLQRRQVPTSRNGRASPASPVVFDPAYARTPKSCAFLRIGSATPRCPRSASTPAPRS
ncbi:hypothetical protein B0H17DRAFT_297093 [Mycena rosella]|nr:hypothetical protein B0H17DRAFT_297093 [Mycena rosella]